MSKLGRHLKQLRLDRDRPRRWVERQSKARYPHSRECHVSHSYLRQMEEGVRQRPNPRKLQTLAEIYEVDYRELMAAAGYLDAAESSLPVLSFESGEQDLDDQQKLVATTKNWLESNDIHFSYFLRGLTSLSKDSLVLVNRLVTTLGIQEKQLGSTKPADDTHPHQEITSDAAVEGSGPDIGGT